MKESSWREMYARAQNEEMGTETVMEDSQACYRFDTKMKMAQ